MMYELCAQQGIPHRNTRKWIVAQDEQQMGELQKVHDFAQSINVPTRFLDREEIERREPDVRAEAGVLESESTGIVDSHAYMAYLEGDFQERGGETAFNTAVARIEPIQNGARGYRIYTDGDDEPIEVETLINSAGLSAMTINNMILPKDRHRKPFYAKGSYFSYSSSHPKPKTLLYPAPMPGHGGLGTHLTLDMTGRIRFGPDVEWVDDPTDLSVNDNRLEEAINMIQDYLPGIDRNAINLDYCGIRPKLGKTSGTAGPNFADFYIKEEKGFPGFINLLGIESPGLTSSLAIGEMVDGILYGSESGRQHYDPHDKGQDPKFNFHH
jgi:2-hydroxyglutarate dehydrogenase